jgi:predicted DNA binding CopG/RHH family protein
MRKKKYTNEPIGKIKIVNDFLPSPEELVLKENTVKVTLLLSRNSIAYFKQEADKHNASYQTMIRSLLDKYAQHYKKRERRP